jgi:hypothetical protein
MSSTGSTQEPTVPANVEAAVRDLAGRGELGPDTAADLLATLAVMPAVAAGRGVVRWSRSRWRARSNLPACSN